jgi:hypothetical protein
MKTVIIALSIVVAASACGHCQQADSPNERIIKEYFAGWVKKDWNAVASKLAEGFTFTSAALMITYP